MKPSWNCEELVAQFEGLSLNAYQDIRGVWTIGYGHTLNVHAGDVWTEEYAALQLLNDLDSAAACVNSHAPALNQNQFDALCSFVYNVGCGAFVGSTLQHKLLVDDMQGAADQFLVWVNAGSQKNVPGLVRRREAERTLFLKPVEA